MPAAAKLMTPFAGTHTLTIPLLPDGENVITVTVALPFSWKCFYAMALCFIVAQVVYWISCPEIIKRYGNVGEYLAQRREDKLYLTTLASDIFRKAKPTLLDNFHKFIASGHTLGGSSSPPSADNLSREYLQKVFNEKHWDKWSTEGFGLLVEIAQQYARPSFYVSALLFFAGFCLLTIVVLQGAWAVLKMSIGTA